MRPIVWKMLTKDSLRVLSELSWPVLSPLDDVTLVLVLNVFTQHVLLHLFPELFLSPRYSYYGSLFCLFSK